MRFESEKTFLLVIDLQERLVPAMTAGDPFLAAATKLIGGARALDVPTVATEQYPKGLGPTVPEVVQALDGSAPILPKRAFSAVDEESVHEQLDALRRSGRTSVVVCGIEAHVCVLQTALDLAAAGWSVLVAVDASASRSPADKAVALQRLAQEGVRLGTVESILFELCRTSLHSAFKAVSALVK